MACSSYMHINIFSYDKKSYQKNGNVSNMGKIFTFHSFYLAKTVPHKHHRGEPYQRNNNFFIDIYTSPQLFKLHSYLLVSPTTSSSHILKLIFRSHQFSQPLTTTKNFICIEKFISHNFQLLGCCS